MKTVKKIRLNRILFFLPLVIFVNVSVTPLQTQIVRDHRTKKVTDPYTRLKNEAKKTAVQKSEMTPVVITANNKKLTRIPSSIGQLTALEVLNINSNNLESLPATLGNINYLTTITAANNNLNTVPSELGQLTNLTLLSLTQNPITSIPQEVCDLQPSNGGILTLLTDQGEGCN